MTFDTLCRQVASLQSPDAHLMPIWGIVHCHTTPGLAPGSTTTAAPSAGVHP
jgi:hypothetical protein